MFAVVLAVTAVVMLLTELTSNTATAAAFLPVVASLAVGIGADPLLLAIPKGSGASTRANPGRPAFVLPLMRTKIALIALVATAGLSVAACDIKTDASGDFSFDISGGKAQDTWARTYTLSDNGRLEIINVNGRITAEPASDGKVTVEGRRTAKGSSDEVAKENLAKLEIREEVSGERVRVESRPPRLSGFGGHEIEWTIKVPNGVVVDLRTVNGGVRINGLQGEVHAKTTNGGVRGKDMGTQTLNASSVNGGIEIEFNRPLDSSASVEIETVNGGVELGLTADSKATISARAVNGGVSVTDLTVEKQAQSNSFESKRRLEGTMNGGGAKVNVSTVNGGVRISRTSGPTT